MRRRSGDNCAKPFMPITFTRVKLPHGWLGNMAPFPVKHDGRWWLTTEALFQSLRFDDEAIKEELRGVKSPMGVKMRAKREKARMVVIPQSEQDLANMEMVLRLKLEQHQELKQQLLDTGNETIIEDCSNRAGGSGKFWGAVLKDGQWIGENMLGRMWMKLRDELKQAALQKDKSGN
jgi:N-glycosidase YbiA